MLKSKFPWRWQSDEPQTIIILVFIFAFIFISPVKGCNPQRNDQQWRELKQRIDIDRTLLKRPAAPPLGGKQTHPPNPPAPNNPAHDPNDHTGHDHP